MYDPLKDTSPGCGENYPSSYWRDHSGSTPADDGQLKQDIDADVVIIGAGYTGLSCALHLAREQGINAVVLEANQTAWGCSGRNAGFILKSTGRMTYGQIEKKWGTQAMHGIYDEMCQGVASVEQLIAEGISCDRQGAGFLKLAHKPAMFAALVQQAKLQQQRFGYQVEILSKQQVRHQYMDDKNAYGAIRYHDGFGVNPLKLAWGYQKLARAAGVKVHTSSPVTAWSESGDRQILHIGAGEHNIQLRAQKVVIATNGYTPNALHPLVKGRTLPVLSQIIVTQPLNAQQLQQCHFLTDNVVMDTRALKYFYRKLPDNRILFGGRGAITGKQANNPYYAQRLLKVLKSSFPALSQLQIDYSWAGWISVSLDDLPHVYQCPQQKVFYAMGYCGSGVAFSVQAGKRLAQKIAGVSVPNLPLYQQPLQKFPFAPFRRVGQWGYFQYGKVKDAWF